MREMRMCIRDEVFVEPPRLFQLITRGKVQHTHVEAVGEEWMGMGVS